MNNIFFIRASYPWLGPVLGWETPCRKSIYPAGWYEHSDTRSDDCIFRVEYFDQDFTLLDLFQNIHKGIGYIPRLGMISGVLRLAIVTYRFIQIQGINDPTYYHSNILSLGGHLIRVLLEITGLGPFLLTVDITKTIFDYCIIYFGPKSDVDFLIG